ncbi:MAG: hypothetical protein ACM3YO_09140 [Bacteroidota bacterium]
MNRQPPDQNPKPKKPEPLPRVVKPTVPLSSVSPEELLDMKVAPGDPYIKAAFERINRPAAPTKMLESGGPDALSIQKAAKRSRSLTFTVQGIMWRAGFAKDLSQTPLGQYTKLAILPKKELHDPNLCIIRPVSAEFEPVFRALIPQALLEACEKMYGLVRILDSTALIYFPRDDGATAGILASYSDGPASRSHILYLQTNIKNASPTVLDQIYKTFEAALPKAKELQQRPQEADVWKEMEKAVLQVKATFRNSSISQNGRKVRSQVRSGLHSAGKAADTAIAQVDRVGKFFEWFFSLPLRGMLWCVKRFSNFLVWLINSMDGNSK